MPQLRSSIPDGGVAARKNANGSALPAKRICKFTANSDEVDLATAATDKLAGVSLGSTASGTFGDVQQYGRAIITAGAAIAVGDRITSGASGKAAAAAPAGGTNNGVIGIAITAASGADVDFECDLFGPGLTFQG